MSPREAIGERGWGARRLGAAAVVLLALAASAFPALFTLDTAALAGGELWRLWTGHLVHGSLAHFAFDVGVAALLVFFFRPRWSLLWMPPAIGIGLCLAYPDLETYHGLSGLLHALVVSIAGRMALERRGLERVVAGAMVLAVLAKATVETVTGSALFTDGIDLGGPVLHGAHLVGAVVGVVAVCVAAVRARIRDGGTRVAARLERTVS